MQLCVTQWSILENRDLRGKKYDKTTRAYLKG
jgi:hypothetical protein